MSDLRKAAQALVNQWESNTAYPFGSLVDALRAALAQPEHDPVAWIRNEGGLFGSDWTPLYTNSPQRKPLTDELIDILASAMVKGDKSVNWLCRVIEAKHGIGGKNEYF
jgi:hypothetical protein